VIVHDLVQFRLLYFSGGLNDAFWTIINILPINKLHYYIITDRLYIAKHMRFFGCILDRRSKRFKRNQLLCYTCKTDSILIKIADFIQLQYHLEYRHQTSNIVWTDFVRWIIS